MKKNPYYNFDDGILLKMHQEGNSNAFKIMYAKYKNYIKFFIFSMVRDKKYAEDLTQDIFIKVLIYLENHEIYKESTGLKSFLVKSAHNLVIDEWRSNKKRFNKLLIRRKNGPDFNVYVPDNNQEEMLCQKETNSLLYTFINSLPKDNRDVILLVLEGFQLKEIKEKLNIPMGTVKSRTFYSKKIIKDIIKKLNLEQDMFYS